MKFDKLAAAALVISAISLTASIWTVIDQRTQWHVTSPAVLDLVDARFVYWRSLTDVEARRLRTDTPTEMTRIIKDGEATDRYGVESELVAYDSATGNQLPGVSAVTIAELYQQIAEAGADKANVIIRRHSRVAFEIKNSGPTSARNLEWTTVLTTNDAAAKSTVGRVSSVPPGGRTFGRFDGYAQSYGQLPTSMCFRTELVYDTLDQEKIRTARTFCYDRSIGVFREKL